MSDVDYRGKVRARSAVIDPGTSWVAAAKQTQSKIDMVRGVILGFLGTYPPMTDEELVERFDAFVFMNPSVPAVSPQSIRTRRHALVVDGKVIDSGLRGKTARGNPAVRWTVTTQ